MALSNLSQISIWPASSPLNPSLEAEFNEFFLKNGVTIRYLLNPYLYYGSADHLFSAESAENRAKAIMDELAAERSSVIFFARGGVGAQELLPKLEGYVPSKFPKILCGFSDSTIILEFFSKNNNITTIHGPSLMSFRAEISDSVRMANWNSFVNLIKGEKKLILAEDLNKIAGPDVTVEGELSGGNLSVYMTLLGTKYAPEFNGKILFFEEVEEKPHKIYRNLLHLQQAGVLINAKAIILGEFSKCEHPKGAKPSLDQVFEQFFDSSSIPVYRTTVFGHGEKISSFPLKRVVELSARGMSLKSPLFN